MRYKIVADSACNVLSGSAGDYSTVPMKIVAEKEYVDDPNLNVKQMVEDLRQYKGKSGSSCPNVGEWLEAFGDREEVFGVTISKHLSGSYNAAKQAGCGYLHGGAPRAEGVHFRFSGHRPGDDAAGGENPPVRGGRGRL